MKRKKGPWADKMFLEGPKLVKEALQEGLELEALFVRDSYSKEDLEEILQATDSNKLWILEDGLFHQVSDTKPPQGLLGIFAKPPLLTRNNFHKAMIGRNTGRILVMENLQDPGNVGTMLRTAYAFNFGGAVLIGNTADPFQPKCLRSGMGAALHLPLLFMEKSAEALSYFKELGIRSLGTAMEGMSLEVYPAEKHPSLALWIGNEGQGLLAQTLEQVEDLISIPMPGGAESLNAGVAAGIIMYKLSEDLS